MKPSVPSKLLWPVKASPEIVSADSYPMDRNAWTRPATIKTIALHQHEYPGKMRLGSRSMNLIPGDVTLTLPNVAFSYHLPRSGEHLCIHFRLLPPLGESIPVPIYHRLRGGAAYVREKIHHIISTFRLTNKSGATGILANRVAGAALQELLLWLALNTSQRASGTGRIRMEKRLHHLLNIIDSRLDDLLTIPDLAKELNLSQDYLSKRFRQTYGCTISRYVLRRRIDVAQHLLLTTTLQVSEIATRVGIRDAQYFNKQFRRFVGMNPTEVRLREMSRLC